MDEERKSREAGWIALRRLADELTKTHGKRFTAAFFEEHHDAIQRALGRMGSAG